MQFYTLEYAVGVPYETYALGMEPKHLGEASKCPRCGKCVGSLPWLPPYHAEVRAFAGKLGDIAYGSGDSLLVSPKFRNAWEKEDLRGIEEFSPVERLRIRPARLGKKLATYFHVAAKLWGTRIDLSRSLIEYDRPITCDLCKSGGIDSVRGFAIDESSWSGEDIFRAWGKPGSMIVSDRVRKLRDDYGLTNVNLTPVEEYFVDHYQRWTPFALSDDA